MIHVVDFEKTAFSTPFRGVLPPSGPQISAESGRGDPLFGNQETWLVPNVHLDNVLPPHAPRSTTPGAAGSGREQTLPRRLLPFTDRRIGKDQTEPDLDDRPLYVSMSPNRATDSDKSNFFSPLVVARPLTILSWPGGARGQRLHACLQDGYQPRCRPCMFLNTRCAAFLATPWAKPPPSGTDGRTKARGFHLTLPCRRTWAKMSSITIQLSALRRSSPLVLRCGFLPSRLSCSFVDFTARLLSDA